MLLKALNFLCEKNAWLNATCNFTLLDVASVIISGAALIFAIFIPVRIANRQDKIALFEKRFAAYSDFLDIKTFAEIIKTDDFSFVGDSDSEKRLQVIVEFQRRKELVLWHFNAIIGAVPKEVGSNTLQKVMSLLSEKEMSIHSLQFLYCKKLKKLTTPEKLNKEIEQMFISLGSFMRDVSLNNTVNDQDRIDFTTNVIAFYDKYADFFEKHLSV